MKKFEITLTKNNLFDVNWKIALDISW